jgi:hypothetical protein
MENATVPLPVPLAPEVTWSQDTLLDATHAHVERVALTPIVPVAPPAGAVTEVLPIKYEQEVSVASSAMLSV